MMAYFIFQWTISKSLNSFCEPVPTHTFISDKSSQPRVADGRAKRIKFLACALGDEMDSTVWQVADGAGNFKTGGDIFCGVTKPDSLDAPGIKNPHA